MPKKPCTTLSRFPKIKNNMLHSTSIFYCFPFFNLLVLFPFFIFLFSPSSFFLSSSLQVCLANECNTRDGPSDANRCTETTTLEHCGCAAAERGFTIDCNNKAAINAAWNLVKNCSSCDATSACFTNFLIVQSHHDHCKPDDLPLEVELGFHDLVDVCGDG